jgi:hypothetical protein
MGMKQNSPTLPFPHIRLLSVALNDGVLVAEDDLTPAYAHLRPDLAA